MTEPVYFATPEDFRAWLERLAGTATELIVGFHKVDSGVPSMTWPPSVDEALRHGWIDGVRKRVDGLRYQIRCTPRRSGSIWSRINIARVAVLTGEGRMRPAALAASARPGHGSGRSRPAGGAPRCAGCWATSRRPRANARCSS